MNVTLDFIIQIFNVIKYLIVFNNLMYSLNCSV